MDSEKMTINWKNHLIELIVVIIGISIAFSLNNWAQENKERRVADNYVQSMIIDLQDDIDQMQNIIDSSENLRQKSMELFGILYSNPDPLSAITHEHTTAYYRVSYFQPHTSTYFSLINSGDLDLIMDFEVRSEISALYTQYYEEMELADNFLHKLVDDNLYPYIIERVQFSQTGIQVIDPLRTTHFTNLAGSFYNMLDSRNKIYKQNMARTMQLQANLKNYLNRN